jgi:transcriptional regulator of acetoin/glycerol metabolism
MNSRRTLPTVEKHYRRRLDKAWDALAAGREPDLDLARAHVRDSWLRALERGLDPTKQRVARVDEATLTALRAEHGEFLLAANHAWNLLQDILEDTDSLVTVTAPSGILLDVHCSPRLRDRAAQLEVSPGFDWSEESGGTNAAGTALALRTAVEAHHAEHFLGIARTWNCAAAPVFDPADDTLLGVIDVTTCNDTYDPKSLAVAITAAQQIEQALHSRELARWMQLMEWYHGVLPRWPREALILVDRKGRIVTANDIARARCAAEGAGEQLWRGRPLLTAQPPADLAACNATLPGWARAAALEAAPAAHGWQGGVLVLDAPGHRPTVQVAALPRVPDPLPEIVGSSAALRTVKQQAQRIAGSTAPVLLLGETGCGKELFARALHRLSPRADGPFVAVNCGTLTRELAASELLGYEPGAFTGAALKGRLGKFEEADGGTLFLDEVGELPLEVQVSLLRVLQDQIIVRVGGNRERRVNVRIVAATNRQLEADVQAQRFRQDLYYRLRVLMLAIPPLRERREDVLELATHFLALLAADYGHGTKEPSVDLARWLAHHDWPGNVRELRATLEAMYLLTDAAMLDVQDLPADLRTSSRVSATPAATGGSIAELEREAILRELAEHDGDRVAAARRLGISRSSLYRKLKRYRLEDAH